MEHMGMVAEADDLTKIAHNVLIKLPLTLAGLKACRYFAQKRIKINVTLRFTTHQALLAAKAGATYILPVLGRFVDINIAGRDLIRDVHENSGFETQILTGPNMTTFPPSVSKGIITHALTDKGLQQFAKDWTATGQTIL